jgi:hypothetical protein
MYRARAIVQVKFGRFKEYAEICEQVNQVARARGWAESTFWVPTTGTVNQVIIETEYPDLAAFQREEAAFYSDSEAMGLIARAVECLVEGSGRTELIEPIPTLPRVCAASPTSLRASSPPGRRYPLWLWTPADIG